MIYWDLDGVLRDLSKSVHGGKIAKTWWQKDKNGHNLIEAINKDLSILESAKPTKYLNVALWQKSVDIISCQPMSWRPGTTRWVERHIPNAKIRYVLDPNEKFNIIDEDDYLIEDSPNLHDYHNIILIDRPYNENIISDIRVYNEAELLAILEELC